MSSLPLNIIKVVGFSAWAKMFDTPLFIKNFHGSIIPGSRFKNIDLYMDFKRRLA